MYTLPISSPLASLENAGGKGANLARLAGFDFLVPDGFIVTTQAYRAYVSENRLDPVIQAALAGLSAADPAALETASERIRLAFASGKMPEEIAREVLDGYAQIGQPPVAVRSSATAEDLPGMSFAGQQDTFLNVSGEPDLLKAVVGCWSSLWTARAIGYRLRYDISQTDVTLAVVVQRMVQSEASGVLFTANPLTGLRSETVIDATLGLGDALVSGQVEPDHYVVDTAARRICSSTLGRKVPISSNGSQEPDRSHIQALPDQQIVTLADLGQAVSDRFGDPQDIEWAWADGKLYLVQSRPITTLFPVPEGLKGRPLFAFVSFGAVQGVLDPFTPLGQDLLRLVFADVGKYLGYALTYQTQSAIYIAGERLWVQITPILTNSFGRKVVRAVLRWGEPSTGEAIDKVWDDPLLQPQKAGMRLNSIFHLLQFVLPIGGRLILNVLHPDRRPRQINARGDQVLADVAAQYQSVGDGREKLRRAIALIEEDIPGMARMIPDYISMIAAGMMGLNVVNQLELRFNPGARSESGFTQHALEITRGVPNNPTTEMDFALWDTAVEIRKDPASTAAIREQSAQALSTAYLAGTLPAPAQKALASFLERYGMRGLGEIDFGRPRWREDPTPLFQTIRSYLEISDPDLAPPAVFEKNARAAEKVVEEIAADASRARGGWLKSRVLRWGARRARAYFGQRESPKFFIIRTLGIFRDALLDAGKSLAAEGILDRPDDIFFLHLDELHDLAQGKPADWQAIVAQNRAVNAREQLRKQVPRLLLSDGRAFYEGMASSTASDAIYGSPVSPGTIEGNVHVVLDPRGARLEPGEILVCPGTDPSWTPLFLAAGGLVMEVGGLMTHGAVVAREYGIPAVVGIHEATQRLKTGQRIRVDGSTGRVELIG